MKGPEMKVTDDYASKKDQFFENQIEQPVDVNGIAKFLGKNPNTVRAWCSTGRVKIPYFKLGNKLMFLRSSVVEWLKGMERN